jgi:ribosome-binding factor A
MPSSRKARRHAVSGALPSYDSIDPSVFFGNSAPQGPDRKTLQLCKQAARALSVAMAGECADDALRDAYVDTVEPAPDASRLLVIVRPMGVACDPDLLLARLRERGPFLRTRVAAAICRKRAPELAFCVAGPMEDDP